MSSKFTAASTRAPISCDNPAHPEHPLPTSGGMLTFECQRLCHFCGKRYGKWSGAKVMYARHLNDRYCRHKPPEFSNGAVTVLYLGTGAKVSFEEWQQEQVGHRGNTQMIRLIIFFSALVLAERTDKQNARVLLGRVATDESEPDLWEPKLIGVVNGVRWLEEKRRREAGLLHPVVPDLPTVTAPPNAQEDYDTIPQHIGTNISAPISQYAGAAYVSPSVQVAQHIALISLSTVAQNIANRPFTALTQQLNSKLHSTTSLNDNINQVPMIQQQESPILSQSEAVVDAPIFYIDEFGDQRYY